MGRTGYRLVRDGEVLYSLIGIGEVRTYLGWDGVDMANPVETPATDNVGHPHNRSPLAYRARHECEPRP